MVQCIGIAKVSMRKNAAMCCVEILRTFCRVLNFTDYILLLFSQGRRPLPRQVWSCESQPGLFSCLVLHLELSKSCQNMCMNECYYLHCQKCRSQTNQIPDRNLGSCKLLVMGSSASSWMVQDLLCCGVKIWTHWKWQRFQRWTLKRNN